MKFTLVGLGLLMLSLCISAQPDYRDGYVILKNGKRLDGLVNYRQFGPSRFHTCEFKSDKSSAKKIYTPAEIDEYGINSLISFHAFTISTDKTSSACFLNLLVDGRASLYEYRNRYFIQANSSTLEELIIIIKRDTVRRIYNGGTYVTIYQNVDRQYRNTLMNRLADCPDLQSDFGRLSYDRRSLVNAIEKYNVCKSASTFSYFNNLKWTEFDVAPFVELESTSLDFAGSDIANSSLRRTKFNKQSIPKLGIKFILSSPRVNHRIALVSGISFGSSHYTGTDSQSDPVTGASGSLHDIQFRSFHVPVYLRYYLPYSFLKPYISSGLDFQFLDNQQYLRIDYNANGSVQSTLNNMVGISNHILSYGAELGMNVSIGSKCFLFLEGRSEFGGQLCRDYVLSKGLLHSNIFRTSLSVGFGF